MSEIYYDGDNGYNDGNEDDQMTIMEKRHRLSAISGQRFFWDDDMDESDEVDSSYNSQRRSYY